MCSSDLESEAAKRKGDALGLGALFAAAELWQSGRTGATSLGEAFKALGKQGAEFTKEEQRIKDKLDDADLALAQAKLSFKKGNLETGNKLVENFEKRRMEAAKIAGDTAYQNAMVASRNRGLSIEESRLAAEKAQFDALLWFRQNLMSAQADAARQRHPAEALALASQHKTIQEAIARRTACRVAGPATVARSRVVASVERHGVREHDPRTRRHAGPRQRNVARRAGRRRIRQRLERPRLIGRAHV